MTNSTNFIVKMSNNIKTKSNKIQGTENPNITGYDFLIEAIFEQARKDLFDALDKKRYYEVKKIKNFYVEESQKYTGINGEALYADLLKLYNSMKGGLKK